MIIFKISKFAETRPILLLICLIAAYTAVFSFICFLKYIAFGYNGFDLGIYNQVFFNSAGGNLFGLTIHPNLYLGDHFEIFILAMLPLYYFWQSPLNLLILQSLFLALCAWPIYLIAKHFLNKNIYALCIALCWLLNPFVQNINLFEFHLLPFSLLFLFFAIYFYLKNKFLVFSFFCLLALTVREDIALFVFMFGPLALIEKRGLKWILFPIMASACWFIIAIKAIAYFTPSGSYKFLYYYSWLGNNFTEIFTNFFLKFNLVLKHLFSWQNIFFISALLIPFGFLPALKPKYLILAFPIFLQILLGGSANSLIVLKIHYLALLLPALLVAALDCIKKILQNGEMLKKYGQLIFLIAIAGVLYGFFTLGPAQGIWQAKANNANNTLAEKNNLIKLIINNSSVLSSYEFLPNLSGRKNIYNMYDSFLGKAEFSNINYETPETDFWLINFDDMLFFAINPDNTRIKNNYSTGDDNLRILLDKFNLKAEYVRDTIVLFAKNPVDPKVLYQAEAGFKKINGQEPLQMENGLIFLGYKNESINKEGMLSLNMRFYTEQKISHDYQINIKIENLKGEIAFEKIYPLAYGLYPTSEWQNGETVTINYWLKPPANLKSGLYNLTAELVMPIGYATLNSLRSAIIQYTSIESLKPLLNLGAIEVK